MDVHSDDNGDQLRPSQNMNGPSPESGNRLKVPYQYNTTITPLHVYIDFVRDTAVAAETKRLQGRTPRPWSAGHRCTYTKISQSVSLCRSGWSTPVEFASWDCEVQTRQWVWREPWSTVLVVALPEENYHQGANPEEAERPGFHVHPMSKSHVLSRPGRQSLGSSVT